MRRSAPRERLERFRTIPLFSGCSDKDLAQVDALVDDLVVTKGTVLAEQGTPARQAFIILDGRADVTIDGKTIAHLNTGDTFGEMALLSKPVELRSATVIAVTDMELLVLETRSFNTLVDMPCVAKRLLGKLSDRLRETDEAVVGS
jgi:CRP/FNR family cyclic AMP-dependent transcriptional regulator